jgi:hypothetical protein
MRKILTFVLILALVFVVFLIFDSIKEGDEYSDNKQINNFEECVEAEGILMESYPMQCRVNDKTFIENIGNELEKIDLIQIDFPRPNSEISSPLEIGGQARGTWFFEGDFPVILTNWDGLIIAEGFLSAEGEWMTENFVDFSGTLEFKKPNYGKNGILILQKDNPSGLPKYDDALEVPIKFK